MQTIKAIGIYIITIGISFAGSSDDALNRIRIPSLNFSQTPIQKVVSTLNSISKDIDPKKEGVNLVVLEPENIDYQVSVSVQNMSYKSALELILKGSDLEYQIESQFVIIKKINKSITTTSPSNKGGFEIASQEQKNAIFTIKIKDRVSTVTQTAYGTGFLAKIKERYFIVTNLHVIRGVADMDSIDIRNINGDRIKIGRVYGGLDHDLVIMEVATPRKDVYAFEFSENTSEIKKGDGVLIIGNPLGEGTILEAKGIVQGVGPQKIEYDAATFAGNSGSPIIHTSTQKVIGIVTYVSTMGLDDFFSKDAVQKTDSPLSGAARRFGTRFDSIKNWEPIIWSEWVKQDRQIYTYWKRLYSFKSLASASDIQFSRKALMLTPELWRAFEKYELDCAANIGPEEVDNAIKRVLFSIDALVNSNSGGYITDIRKSEKEYYSFYREELELLENEQIRFNELWLRNKMDLLHTIAISKLHRASRSQ